MTASFSVSDPRDRIYALLSIAKDTTPVTTDKENRSLSIPTVKYSKPLQRTIRKPYVVDYSQDNLTVYMEFVNFTVHNNSSTSALDTICRAWAPASSKRTQDVMSSYPITRAAASQELPSWVPSFEVPALEGFPQLSILKMNRRNSHSLVGPPMSNRTIYSAAGTQKVDRHALRFKQRNGIYSMYVKGFRLDMIVSKGVTSQGGYIPWQWLQDAGWNSTLKHPPEQFWKTLVADRDPDGRKPPGYYSRACKVIVDYGGTESGSINTT